MGKCLFITATGTEVGKTYITALIVKKLRQGGLNAGYYKAAVSGVEEGQLSDPEYVNQFANIGEEFSKLVSYTYKEAVSPHLAARLNSKPIDFKVVEQDFQHAKSKYDFLTVEGSGGIICPLRWDDSEHLIIDDLIKRLELSVLVVAPAELGSINTAVLTIEHLNSRKIPVKGIILNFWNPDNFMIRDNAYMIEELTKVPIVAKVQSKAQELDINLNDLIAMYD